MSTVFVTGPTGVLGRATIPLLVAKGYTVRALSRSAANDATIRALGAEPVRGNLFDVGSLQEAMRGADAIFHLATRIPASSEVKKREAWRENDRVRAEGARNLVDAGIAAGARTFVYPSFAFVYPDRGDAWVDAATTRAAPIETLTSTIVAEEEVARFAASDPTGERRGVALRLGGLYGPDLSSTREQIEMARRGISILGGSPKAFTPMLWIDDAATALVAALERAPSGLYDVVDDEPLRQRELASIVAEAVGRKRLFSPPPWMLRMMAGPTAALFARSVRISNRRFREATGWAPAVPNAREGFARMAGAGALPPRQIVPGPVKAGLWAMALITLIAGVQQQFAPRSFYDTFPGFGMQWVSVDGPYNEHLLRDLGGANLALTVVIFFAIARPTVGLVRAVSGALLIAQAPHFIYHAAHLGLLPSLKDQVLQTASLTIVVLAPLLIFIGARGIHVRDVSASSGGEGVSKGDRAIGSPLIAPAR